MPAVRIAVQAGSGFFDAPRTPDRLAALSAEAAAGGARLGVFPEVFVGGYPKGLEFGARMSSRTPEGREEFRRYSDAAVEVSGPAAEMIRKVARDHGLYLVVGAVGQELNKPGGEGWELVGMRTRTSRGGKSGGEPVSPAR
jgi:nitrilase